jgi:hypothetical protein
LQRIEKERKKTVFFFFSLSYLQAKIVDDGYGCNASYVEIWQGQRTKKKRERKNNDIVYVINLVSLA